MANYNNRNYNRNRRREQYTTNEYIKATKLRVIDGNENLGVISRDEAIKIAREKELDLVLIAEKADPPVAKIIDLAKYKYQEQQKKQKAKAKTKKQELKEFRIGVNTGENDVSMRVERSRKFLRKKDKVRFNLRFRGRENAHRDLGYKKLEQIVAELSDVSKKEDEPKLNGNTLSVTLIPK
jgi:translation initiation factor IF-3